MNQEAALKKLEMLVSEFRDAQSPAEKNKAWSKLLLFIAAIKKKGVSQ